MNHTHPAPVLDCVETTSSFQFTAGNVNWSATCAANRAVTGGSYSITGTFNAQEISVFRSHTNYASRRFEVALGYVGNSNPTLTVYAICCRLQ